MVNDPGITISGHWEAKTGTGGRSGCGGAGWGTELWFWSWFRLVWGVRGNINYKLERNRNGTGGTRSHGGIEGIERLWLSCQIYSGAQERHHLDNKTLASQNKRDHDSLDSEKTHKKGEGGDRRRHVTYSNSATYCLTSFSFKSPTETPFIKSL